MRIKLLLLLFPLLAVMTWGQKWEFGGTIGGGSYVAEDTGSPAHVVAGAEFCGFCARGVSLFGGYTHWQFVSGGYEGSRITSVDLFEVGVRLQGGRRVRPFFDAGFAGGWDRFELYRGSDSHANPGGVLGGGVAIGMGERWYIRPQARFYLLKGFHAGFSGTVGVGWRF